MKKRYYCMMKPLRNPDEFQRYMELLDDDLSEIYIFDCLEVEDHKVLEDIINAQLNEKEEDVSYCFMTNQIQWLIDLRVSLERLFDAYIYYNREKPDDDDVVGVAANDLKETLYFSDPKMTHLREWKRNDAILYAFDVNYLFEHLNHSPLANRINGFLSMYVRWEDLGNYLRDKKKDDKECFKQYLISKLTGSSDYAKVFFYSFILQNWRDRDYIGKLIEIAQNSKCFTIYNKWFLYAQLSAWFFVEPDFVNEDVRLRMYQLYESIYHGFKDILAKELEFIPKRNRIEERVIVFTGQFLDVNHAPSSVTLDRCYTLQSKLGKKTILINTAEFLRWNGSIPFSRIKISNYADHYKDVGVLAYKELRIHFFQCSDNMPDLMEIRKIIQFVKDTKPYYIISVGPTLVADLCSNLAPVITVATIPSEIAITKGQFVQIGRKLTKEDVRFLKKCGMNEKQVIEGISASTLLTQKSQLTRKELGLPEDKFIITVVGNRLNDEVSDEFVKTLNQLYVYNVFVAFIGAFDKGYKEYCLKYSEFKKNTKYIGYQEDLLACYDCCDLYVNPKRRGAAGTLTLAMHKGVPVITMDYGDAAVFTGQSFAVSSYDEMKKEIIRYISDSDYYKMKSELAKETMTKYKDSETAFKDVLQKAIESDCFK